MRYLPISNLVAISVIRSTVAVSQCLCSDNPYFTMAPKCKNSDAEENVVYKVFSTIGNFKYTLTFLERILYR